ncbi:MAG: M14 family zinc carboxypeptidase [Pirellulaceae bacterium]
MLFADRRFARTPRARVLLGHLLMAWTVLLAWAVGFMGATTSTARADDLDLLPGLVGAIECDRSILTPSEFIGFEMGERHWQHHQVIAYMHYLADRSSRARWESYAESHQGRELGYLTIASQGHWRRMDRIRAAHRQLADPTSSAEVDTAALPAIVLMGYGVHGDEPSATHVSLIVAHLLVAGRGEWVNRVLDQLVIRIDPCLNPDGFERFSSWSNTFRGRHPSNEPWDREHRQAWPGGRVNGYWFDLNRDWFPLVHPESQGRLRQYHQWRPVLVLDYHEMGTDSTYFFQPGEPRRTNPFAPASTQELTRRLANYHAAALDAIGTRYFTEERFDDFYPGKGSTYPDLKGAVGILFEQSSARGVMQQGAQGDRTLRGNVRNQLATSCSSLTGAVELRTELLDHVRQSYLEARDSAEAAPLHGYAFSAGNDVMRLRRFAELLGEHEIQSSYVREAVSVTSEAGAAIELPPGPLIVPARQPDSRFMNAVFDRSTEFEENAFYDVSAWALPLAYGLEQVNLLELPGAETLTNEPPGLLEGVGTGPAVAFLLPWDQEGAAAELIRVSALGCEVQVASESFEATTSDGHRSFGAGSLAVFPRWDEELGALDVESLRRDLEPAMGVRWYAVATGLTDVGIDWGSGAWRPLPQPRIAIVVGDGTDRYASGAAWHRLDARLGAQVTLIDSSDLRAACQEDWTTIVLAGGTPAGWGPAERESLESWLGRGGTLVVLGDANGWAAAQGWLSVKPREEPPFERRPYAQAADDRALQAIAGAIVERDSI